MSKKVYNTIVILSISLICSIVFLGISILYGFTHQATKHYDGLDFGEEWDPYTEFVIGGINGNF